MDANRILIVKNFEEEANNLKSPLERQLAKKRFIVNVSAISNFWGDIDLYKKKKCAPKIFQENLGFLFFKNYVPIQFFENI